MQADIARQRLEQSQLPNVTTERWPSRQIAHYGAAVAALRRSRLTSAQLGYRDVSRFGKAPVAGRKDHGS